MCFSAVASFTSGTLLSAAGVATLTKVDSKKDFPLAVIPLLFGIQQITEGFVWVSLSNANQTCTAVSSYGFLFFAFVLWPAFIPFVASRGENNLIRQKIFKLFQLGGLLVAFYFLYFMIKNPLLTHISQNSISYFIASLQQFKIAGAYVFFTCGSLLFSKQNVIRTFGALSTAAVAITYYFYQVAFTSVWCFFAAILSSIIYFYFDHKQKHQQ
jgi:hypothetical protein